jgi:hypothetical protein
VASLTERVFDQCTRGRVNVLRLPEVNALSIDAVTAAEFDSVLDATEEGGWIDYASNRPKHLFLRYLGEGKRCLLHGSNDADIAEFEPRTQETYTGDPVEAVFATDDGIWVLFFALVARPPVWSLRNACNVRGGRRRYFFAIDTDPRAPESWTDGAVYLFPPDTFTQTYDAEWISPTPVRPRARLAVTRADFPYADRVFRHRFGESDAAFIARLTRSGLLRP